MPLSANGAAGPQVTENPPRLGPLPAPARSKPHGPTLKPRTLALSIVSRAPIPRLGQEFAHDGVRDAMQLTITELAAVELRREPLQEGRA